MKIIECTHLTKEYLSGDNVVKAVDDITISFEQGEICAITGPSGSGKSTFLHMLSSLEYPTSGYVTYGEKKLSDYNDNQLSILRRRRFGFVFQSYNLVQELTGYENILLPIMLDKKKPDEEYLNKIIKILGIEDRVEHLPSTNPNPSTGWARIRTMASRGKGQGWAGGCSPGPSTRVISAGGYCWVSLAQR